MHTRRVVGTAVGAFALWTAATWLLEGRIEALRRPDAALDRAIYALVANLLIGLALGMLILRRWRDDSMDPGRSGFGSGRRSAAWIAVGAVAGLAFYRIQGTPSTHPVVILNAFAQVFVVSAAEVLVCWALVGRAVEAALGSRGRATALAVAAIVASLSFGIYHFAHSPPFNTWRMVALLSVVGLATSAFFFLSRDVAGTIVFHNFLGTFGVVQALRAAGSLAAFEQPQPALLMTAVVTSAVLAGGYYWLRRDVRRTA
ncbi:hypothetical protein PE066_01995 [Ramlibacter tataouinensis]|uniref:hypothetical protein n=1 Tax=Ramlibacter tataouinensis TaxID=94132 RepID=UPI0022F40068|nr:hypothetical protein [Ramlibacter tataouinensis]WBY02326.1 hypothetical protein PE066_01995 [Ramlibacter tataouinensis]